MVIALLSILITIPVHHLAGSYTTNAQDLVAVPDLLLSVIPPIDFSFVFVYGIVFCAFILVVYPFLFEIKRFPWYILTICMLILTRSFFILFTGLKIPIGAIWPSYPGIISGWFFNNDLFFSGHVAIPFLGYLMSRNKWIKWFFLLNSIILPLSSLFMHRHYSIDIFAAYFITYGIFRLSQRLQKFYIDAQT